jgi:hypothetical protein
MSYLLSGLEAFLIPFRETSKIPVPNIPYRVLSSEETGSEGVICPAVIRRNKELHPKPKPGGNMMYIYIGAGAGRYHSNLYSRICQIITQMLIHVGVKKNRLEWK